MDGLNPPSKNGINEQGFTLVELLVVIFIIGLMSSVVVMSLPKRVSDARQQSDELVSALSSLSRESIALGESISWTHVDGHNIFDRYHSGEWIALPSNSRSLANSSNTGDVKISVKLLTMEIERQNVIGKSENAESPVVFFPTGEATAAEIRISGSDFDLLYNLSSSGQLVYTPDTGRPN